MGQCISVVGDAVLFTVPMPNNLQEVVDELLVEEPVFDNYDTFVEKYTMGMKEKAGEPFECDEVLDPATESGKRILIEGISTEAEVQDAAFCASTGEAAKGFFCEKVWEELEEDATELAVKKSHQVMDYIVGKKFDAIRDELALKLKEEAALKLEEETALKLEEEAALQLEEEAALQLEEQAALQLEEAAALKLEEEGEITETEPE
jgi:hypothetical protein